jgi:ATP-binding cassette subfamily F protein uup
VAALRAELEEAAALAERARKPGKLSFKEQRELEGIEAAILAAEERKAAAEATLSDPATYQRGGEGVAALRAELEEAAALAERLYARWQELESIASAALKGGPG